MAEASAPESFFNENQETARYPIDLDLGDGRPRSQRIKLGLLLNQHRDQLITADDEYFLKLEAVGTARRAKQWKLVQMPRPKPASSLFSSSQHPVPCTCRECQPQGGTEDPNG